MQGLTRHPVWVALIASVVGHLVAALWWHGHGQSSRRAAPTGAVVVLSSHALLPGGAVPETRSVVDHADDSSRPASDSRASAMALQQANGATVAADAAADTADMAQPDEPVNADIFWPSDQVDMRALPMMPPMTSALTGMAWPGYRVRLRLAIDASGMVVDVRLQPDDDELAASLAPLLEMFRRMQFMPARRQGQDVASIQVIEVDSSSF